MPHQKLAVEDAYAMAGVGSKDIDVCQFYDNFTSSVLVWFEHAGSFVENGRISLGGELPVNTASGNLSESYTEGWLHIVEGVKQMRGQCGPRQVKSAQVCLVTARGQSLNCADATILRKG